MSPATKDFLDPRAWKLADVIILATLCFNLGVTWKSQQVQTEAVAAMRAEYRASIADADSRARDAARDARDLRDRVIRLEAELADRRRP